MRLKKELMVEEQYLRKADLSADILCEMKHPFTKIIERATL